MDKGIYCLVFKNPGCTIRVGALGNLTFQPGWHIYVGSALGSGGLHRLRRHISLAHLRDKRSTWHVDYLLTHTDFSLRYAVYAFTQERFECGLARAFGDSGIPAFGCSDCLCLSHLFYRQDDPKEDIISLFLKFRLTPRIKTIMSS
jgi:Uri superfamily endonuclease